MKFVGLRKFSGKTLEQVVKYASVELGKALTDLYVGLSHLKFADNFDHFFEDIEVATVTAVAFPNRLKTEKIIWFPVRCSYPGSGSHRPLSERSTTPITAETITLFNPSATTITATILVMRR